MYALSYTAPRPLLAMSFLTGWIPPLSDSMWPDIVRQTIVIFAASAAASSAMNKQPYRPLYDRYFWKSAGYTAIGLVVFWTVIFPLFPSPA